MKALLEEIRTAPIRPVRGRKATGWVQAAASASLVASVTLASAGCKEKSHPTEMVAIPSATASGPPPKPDAEVIPPLGPEGLIKPTVGAKLLPVLQDVITPAQDVEIEIWFSSERKVEKVIVHSPKLDSGAERRIFDEVRRLELSERDPDVRGQRFVVRFSKSEFTPSTPDASPAPKPTTTTHMKERVPRPEMAPRPPPRPEMAPRPPKPGDKSGPGF